MTTMIGRFETPRASQYLQQLCKHFAHKTEASFDEISGTVILSVAQARLAADDQALTVTLDVSSPEQVTRARDLIDSHLMRFAFREGFKQMDWQEVAADTETHVAAARKGNGTNAV